MLKKIGMLFAALTVLNGCALATAAVVIGAALGVAMMEGRVSYQGNFEGRRYSFLSGRAEYGCGSWFEERHKNGNVGCALIKALGKPVPSEQELLELAKSVIDTNPNIAWINATDEEILTVARGYAEFHGPDRIVVPFVVTVPPGESIKP